MRNYATGAFCVFLVLCSTAVADNTYCLQYPLFADPGDPTNVFFAFDVYTEPAECGYDFSNYGWRPSTDESPQICSGMPPCGPEPQPDGASRQLRGKIKKTDKLLGAANQVSLMPSEMTFRKNDPNNNDDDIKWKPRKGIIDKFSVLAIVPIAGNDKIVVKVFFVILDFKEAVKDDDIVLEKYPPRRFAVFGIETDARHADVEDEAVTATLVDGDQAYRGKIKILGFPEAITITTNTGLR